MMTTMLVHCCMFSVSFHEQRTNVRRMNSNTGNYLLELDEYSLRPTQTTLPIVTRMLTTKGEAGAS